jgi:corrinoid protein of di/trimethylamine methyltransferase
MKSKGLFEKLEQSIFRYDDEAARKTVIEILDEGVEPAAILDEFVSIAKIMGEKFERGELFLPELMLTADAMKVASDTLMSEIERRKMVKQARKLGTVVIATVSGDIHDIGKNIFAFLLKANGFEIHDLGRDVPSLEIVKRTSEIKPDILALSALMTTSMPSQKEVIELLKAFSLREKLIVLIGGAPTTQEWAEEIGADGWAGTAPEGVRVTQELMKKREK